MMTYVDWRVYLGMERRRPGGGGIPTRNRLRLQSRCAIRLLRTRLPFATRSWSAEVWISDHDAQLPCPHLICRCTLRARRIKGQPRLRIFSKTGTSSFFLILDNMRELRNIEWSPSRLGGAEDTDRVAAGRPRREGRPGAGRYSVMPVCFRIPDHRQRGDASKKLMGVAIMAFRWNLGAWAARRIVLVGSAQPQTASAAGTGNWSTGPTLRSTNSPSSFVPRRRAYR